MARASDVSQLLQMWFSPPTKNTGKKGGNSREITRCVCLLQVKLQLVGCDAILLVEGRELVYLKLLDVDAFLSAAPPGARLLPGDAKLSLALNAGDVALRDLQVRDSGKPRDRHRGIEVIWSAASLHGISLENVHCSKVVHTNRRKYACSKVVHTNR